MPLTNECYDFWKARSADAKGMCLNEEASEFDEAEKNEIYSYLPDISSKTILELGAGIGRFTGFFALLAFKVVAVDFSEKFIKKNKETNSNYSNITYMTRNAMDLDFNKASFDLIFMNWMLMYLSDDETRFLAARIQNWLKLNGKVFLRESCTCASIPDKPMPHTHYRDPNFYSTLFNGLIINSHGNIKLYEEKYDNSNQLWWIFELKSLT